jgi:hypothetical protein
MEAPWNSLEVVKLGAGLLTPVLLAIFGIYIHRVTKRFEHSQWRSQKLIERRLSIYDSLAPDFNDLVCYFTYVGCWRDLDPDKVVALKRSIDKRVYLAAPLFSKEFFDSCMAFQSVCFATYNGWGRDASLNTHFERRREARQDDWRPEWESLFSQTQSTPAQVRSAYDLVMTSFARDIGVHNSFAIPQTGRPPENVR